MIEENIVGKPTVVFGVEFRFNLGISFRVDSQELKFL